MAKRNSCLKKKIFKGRLADTPSAGQSTATSSRFRVHRSTRGIQTKRSSQCSVQHGKTRTRWLTVRFSTGVLMTTCSALDRQFRVFLIFIPRMWVGAEVSLQDDQDPVSGGISARKTGLATSVRLSDLRFDSREYGTGLRDSTDNNLQNRTDNLGTKSTPGATGVGGTAISRSTVLTSLRKVRSLERRLVEHTDQLPRPESLNAPPWTSIFDRKFIWSRSQLKSSFAWASQSRWPILENSNPFGDFNEITGIAVPRQIAETSNGSFRI